MMEAGLPTFILNHFIEHPGMIILIILFVLIQRWIFFKTSVPYGLIFIIAGIAAVLILAFLSPALLGNAGGYFTDLLRR